jgi:hypothetical protein
VRDGTGFDYDRDMLPHATYKCEGCGARACHDTLHRFTLHMFGVSPSVAFLCRTLTLLDTAGVATRSEIVACGPGCAVACLLRLYGQAQTMLHDVETYPRGFAMIEAAKEVVYG